ncbi:MAG: hypothetical protein FWD11_08825, partial [Micrococcales bacterium]|nr:hypothetical protein [Micrococcales bacterium]
RLVELDGLRLPPARSRIARWRRKDGVAIVRAWVTAGGVTIPEATDDELGDTVLPNLRLPVVVPGVWSMRWLRGPSLYAGFRCNAVDSGLATVPFAVEYLCSFGRASHKHLPTDRGAGATYRDVQGIAKAYGPFGRATYTYLAMRFARPDGWSGDVTDLILQGRFDPTAFRDAICRVQALPAESQAEFSFVRFATRCTEVASAGAVSGIWPSLTAMAAVAVANPKLPAGTVDVLRVAAQYARGAAAHLPPDQVIPDEVRTFAASTSKSKAVAEARAWLAAVA